MTELLTGQPSHTTRTTDIYSNMAHHPAAGHIPPHIQREYGIPPYNNHAI